MANEKINLTTFFAYARKAPFGNRLTQEQIDGMSAIFEVWDVFNPGDLRYLAYMLATAFHETGAKMVPVREGFAKTDAAARKIVANRAYGAVNSVTKHVYYGRGLVQLTWPENYSKMGVVVNADLFGNPDLALDPHYSANILIVGMIQGLFTGKKLADFFNDSTDDAVGARRIINKLDKAELIAGYYESFLASLRAGDTSTPQPVVKAEDGKADSPSLAKDPATIGVITSLVGTGGAGLLTAVNNPWAFAAVAVVGVGLALYFTGRLSIRRRAGA